MEEIKFYQSSPPWFKKAADLKKFDSKLLNKKDINYSEYYKVLTTKLKKNKNFISDRYIELGEYPQCMEIHLNKVE